MSAALPRPIADSLASLRRSLRRWLWAVGLSRLCVVGVALVFVSLLVDRYLRMDRAQRALSLALAVGALGLVAWRAVVRVVRRRPSDDELAWDVELRHPSLGQSLISAVQLAGAGAPGCSPALVEAAIGEGAARVRSVNVRSVLDASRRNRNLLMGAGALAILAAVCMAIPGTMRLWFQRNVLLSNVAWPQKTHLTVQNLHDNALRVPRGDDLEVWVKVRVDPGAAMPQTITVDHKARQAGSGSESMVRVGDDSFRWTYRNVLEPMRIRFHGGDAVTEWIDVQLAERPTVRDLKLVARPPAYTGLAPQPLPLGEGSYYVLRGSSLAASGTSNKALRQIELWRGKDAIGGGLSVSHASFRMELEAAQLLSGAYQFVLTDTEGLWSKPPTRFTIKITEDAKPQVRAKLEGIGELITARASIPVSFKITDDYGVTEVALAYHDPAGAKTEDGSPTVKRNPLPDVKRSADRKEASHSFRFEAQPLQLSADSHLTLYVEARDNDALYGPKTGQSATFSLRVVTDEALRNELLRREQEQRQEFERLLEQQKTLLKESTGVRDLASTQPAWPEAEHRRVKDAEKRQRLMGQRCDAIATQFSQILAEVENNKLEETEGPVRKRLNDGIINPLRSLATGMIPQAADHLDQAASGSLAKPARLESLTKAAGLQEQIVAKMRDILRIMVKWEGYQEAVLLLREILKDQKDINEETIKAEEERIRRIFGGSDDRGTTRPATRPAPR